jgi:hypothetical protein
LDDDDEALDADGNSSVDVVESTRKGKRARRSKGQVTAVLDDVEVVETSTSNLSLGGAEDVEAGVGHAGMETAPSGTAAPAGTDVGKTKRKALDELKQARQKKARAKRTDPAPQPGTTNEDEQGLLPEPHAGSGEHEQRDSGKKLESSEYLTICNVNSCADLPYRELDLTAMDLDLPPDPQSSFSSVLYGLEDTDFFYPVMAAELSPQGPLWPPK